MSIEVGKHRESGNGEGFDCALREASNAHKTPPFLKTHPKDGFTPEEVHGATAVTQGSGGMTDRRLVGHQLVCHAEYWAIGDDDRVGRVLGMASSLEAIAECCASTSREH